MKQSNKYYLMENKNVSLRGGTFYSIPANSIVGYTTNLLITERRAIFIFAKACYQSYDHISFGALYRKGVRM